ncbi:sulfite exporter TauE/SafE family protein [Photobacterium sp. 1_MG-2023]|uniref:sulfite exporter TauE/SafE family protein n=1 Tax=Photobacterium sp. 1_MG-2023 TaxID=3062646 RepID=UPI0026E1C7A1|nr:sulfite exporter TauE/SafE family protein [Photobacterium sp. 1_MG-2023]MDO6705349.1 sulfite exporter TauE/SafE family protein [Photobacterium sp. 1_MG-2023]
MSTDFFAAFMIGLLGAGHCLGMCGGIAAAITLGMPGQQQQHRFPFLLCYNLGRLVSYAAAGALIGGAVAGMASLSGLSTALLYLRLLAALMMILLALYLGQWWQGVTKIEAVGQILWRRIAPLAQSMLPLKSPISAFPFGLLWGWLPCGLVYSTLSWAAVAGNTVSGAGVMLAFGLGTLPAMLLVGSMAERLKLWLSNQIFKKTSAVLLLVYGIHTGYIAITQFS